jgi:hypothetical protein
VPATPTRLLAELKAAIGCEEYDVRRGHWIAWWKQYSEVIQSYEGAISTVSMGETTMR